MKALIISALLFFSLRAMSSEVEIGENKKSECPYADQSLERKPKVVIENEDNKKEREESTVLNKKI